MARLIATERTEFEQNLRPEARRRPGLIRWLVSSLAVRLVIVLVVFSAVPVVVYQQLRAADLERRGMLLESSQREGALIGAAVKGRIKNSGNPIPTDLSDFLADLVSEDTRVRLLFSPGEGAAVDFFYVAAVPSVPTSRLEVERQELIERGILSRLAETCSGNMPVALRMPADYGAENGTNADELVVDEGDAHDDDASVVDEILTSITPVRSDHGCWALVTSHSARSYLESSIGQPYWQTPEVRVAGLIYLAMAALVIVILFGMWRNLRRFGGLARDIRERGAGTRSFAAQNTVPELHEVARDFDRLVQSLDQSAEAIRRAAEDNAHAFKTPIGIIRQSIEPLRRAADGSTRATRSVELIEQAIARLDQLVTVARQIDRSSADTVEPSRGRIDLSRLLQRMMTDLSGMEDRENVRFNVTIARDIHVLGSEDLIETILENLVDNAISFSPPGGRIDVSLAREAQTPVLTVADQGPGVDPSKLERIFERYYSGRHGAEPGAGSENGNAGVQHFGIGLWIVRRYAEALGGRVIAQNRQVGGLQVRVIFEPAR